MTRHLGPEAAKNSARRQREGFFEKYLSGRAILDIGYRGGNPQNEPITERAIGVDLDHPGYDGITLPFSEASQDAVFASHVLEHILDPVMAIADWYRTLKIGGYLVIAVPHRDLYERKAVPPSRFNTDHKRFYTPASLMSEIEDALPLGGYRVRSLKDIDDGFDYSVPPNKHAQGCYEIELVIEKLPVPSYADYSAGLSVSDDTTTFYVKLLHKAVRAERLGKSLMVCEILETLSVLPLPSYPVVMQKLYELTGGVSINKTEELVMHKILRDLVDRSHFDEEFYLNQYPDITAEKNPVPKLHFVRHGYFEGRLSHR